MASVNGILTAYNEVGMWPGLFADPETVEAWQRVLADIDDDLLEPALLAHARGSKWTPVPADIVKWVGDQLAGAWPAAGVVYEHLARHAAAMRDHLVSPSLNPKPAPLPADLAHVYEACGGRRALLDGNQSAGRANVREVLKVMEAAASREFLALGGARAVRAVAGVPVADTSRQLPPSLHGAR